MRSPLREKTERKTKISLLFLLTVAALPLWAKAITLTFKSDFAEYSVSFDSSRISELQVRELITLSPFVAGDTDAFSRKDFWAGVGRDNKTIDKSFIALPLELCLKDDPAYAPCGEHDIRAVNFLRNAQVNLEKTRRGLAWLQRLAYPKQLQPAVKFLRQALSFSLWIQETRFRYYNSWDERVLRKSYEGLEPGKYCEEAFRKLQGARSNEERYKIVRGDWANCMNSAAKNRLGQYPTASWNSFLNAYGIREQFKDKFPD